MVKSLFEINVDGSLHPEIKQKQIDHIKYLLNQLLTQMRTSGQFKLKCLTKIPSHPHLAGKLRIGIFDKGTRSVRMSHQMGTQDRRFEFAFFIPGNHDPVAFHDRFCKFAVQVPGIILGTKQNGHVLPEEEDHYDRSIAIPPRGVLAQPVQVPVVTLSAPREDKVYKSAPRNRELLFKENPSDLRGFMECLAEVADGNGVVTREQIASTMTTLAPSITTCGVGQRIRILKELGELVQNGAKNQFQIQRLAEYCVTVETKQAPSPISPTQLQSTIVSVVTEEAKPIDSAHLTDLDEFAKKSANATRLVAEYYMEAMDLMETIVKDRKSINDEIVRRHDQIKKLQVELAGLQNQLVELIKAEKGCASVLAHGSVHEVAARQMGLIK